MTRRLLCFIVEILMLITTYADNRALIVGIGQYMPNSGWISINGDSDIDLIVPVLNNNGFTKDNIKTLRNSEATKNNIKKELVTMAKNSKPGDIVYFHFSGHGQRVVDYNKDEEKGLFDQSIVPYDALFDSRNGYNGEKHLIDDELSSLLNAIKIKLGSTGKLIVVVDACYSQGIDKGEEWEELNYDEEIIYHPRGSNDKFIPKDSTWLKSIKRPKEIHQGGIMYVISASRSSEMNFQFREPKTNKIYGSLSYCIYTLLKSKVSFDEWENYFNIKKSWKSTNPKFFPYQTPSVKVVN